MVYYHFDLVVFIGAEQTGGVGERTLGSQIRKHIQDWGRIIRRVLFSLGVCRPVYRGAESGSVF
jgi:hypothetical protein